ncbi:MAG: thiamine biosynthesis protein ThiS [Nitrospirae bacterium CG_4_9_14_3_um_filter_51_5]|nr:MAG: thiamine biosynthesis protein ThiS [Nitrospirae bacterium CG_4_9_14_3_um_filter_51_5]
MKIVVNGEQREADEPLTVAQLLQTLHLRSEQVAVEINLKILDRGDFLNWNLHDGDKVEILSFIGGGSLPHEPTKGVEMIQDPLIIAGRTFRSRLWVGTGKYQNFEETRKAIEASGADVVTVAVRRVNITDNKSENLLDYLDPKKYTILPNTAGCYTVEDAVRYSRLARAAGVSDLVKLEVIGDERTLFPDTAGLLEAAKILIAEGFVVLPYTNDDPIVAKKLADIGCPAVMPLAAPIGSGLGIRNPYNLKIIMETVNVPVIVDAGVGTASDAALAMEYGADAVLMNTAIAGAKDPLMMATAMRYAVDAGRLAYKAGRIPRKLYATASSPIEGML